MVCLASCKSSLRSKSILSVTTGLALLGLSACGGSLSLAPMVPHPNPLPEANPITAATPNPFAYAYVPAQYDNVIYNYQLNRTTGEILPNTQSSIPTQILPLSTALSSDHRFLFAANFSSTSISSYSINWASGELTLVTHFPLPAKSSPGWISAHPKLPVIYVAASGTGMIAVLDIHLNGNLSLRGLVQAGPGVTGFAINSSGTVLFSAQQNADQISAFEISATGDLRPLSSISMTKGANPNQIELSHSGKFLYAANWGSKTVSAFSVQGSDLQSLGRDVSAGGPVFTVNISPDDRFVYAMQPYTQQFSTHFINSDGSLSAAILTARPGAVWISFFSHFAFLTSWTYHPEGLTIDSVDYAQDAGLGSIAKFKSTPHRGMYQTTILE